jgi:hypothetical protein
MNGDDLWDIVRIGMLLGTVLLTVGICAIVLNMIRPKKGSRRDRETDPAESEELWRIVDVMEARLDVLERAMSDQIEAPRGRERERDFLLTRDGQDTGRTQ